MCRRIARPRPSVSVHPGAQVVGFAHTATTTPLPRRPASPAGIPSPSRLLFLLMGKQFEEFEDDGVVLKYRRHSNGRGLVAMTAKADPTAFVAPSAYIEADSRVDRD